MQEFLVSFAELLAVCQAEPKQIPKAHREDRQLFNIVIIIVIITANSLLSPPIDRQSKQTAAEYDRMNGVKITQINRKISR